MPKFHPAISPAVAHAALVEKQQYRETRLALQLPVPDFYREPPRSPDQSDDAVALVLDRDGEFSWIL